MCWERDAVHGSHIDNIVTTKGRRKMPRHRTNEKGAFTKYINRRRTDHISDILQVYLCKNLRISCLASPSSSHAFANSTLIFSALLLISCPFSLRHRSIVCRTSIPTASRDPAGVSPFLCKGLRPSPLLTWKSSKAAWRFSVTCTAATG